jgi:hypothetical protein
MILCPDCGTQNDATAKFCKSCGRSLSDVSTKAASTPPPAADVQGTVYAADGLPVGEELEGELSGERLLWRGRPSLFLSPRKYIMNRYRLTSHRLQMVHGFIGRRTEEIELFRVNDVAVKQNILERILGRGDISVETTDSTAPVTTLINLPDPDRIKDLIRAASRADRQRTRVLVREDM